MTEVKHNFLKSKMNKDLDARLMPDGEYRDALNIGINRSEGPNVGVIENIIGTTQLTNFNATLNGLSVANVSVIGYVKDSTTSIIYAFLTDYTDTSHNHLDNFAPANIEDPPGSIVSYGAYCAIVMWDVIKQTSTTLVEGNFLNFSKTHEIYGVNILENFLCWTDNRNQPRKIDINKAFTFPATSPTPYYTTEDHISVAKYYPYQTMKLVVPDYGAGTGYTSSLITASEEWNPPHFISSIYQMNHPNWWQIKIAPSGGPNPPTPANLLVESGLLGAGNQFYEIKVENAQHPEDGWFYVIATTENAPSGELDVIQLADQDGVAINPPSSWNVDDQLLFSYSNPDYDYNYSGDPKFLEDKFVRFSYRFKYDNDEYSLMAPFTQSAFIPKQWGSFLSGNSIVAGGDDVTNSDEFKTASSGIVEIMENQVDKVICNIPLPCPADELDELLHVENIEILMKESNSNVVKVVDTLDSEVYSRPRELTAYIKWGSAVPTPYGYYINLPFNPDLNDYIGSYVYLADGTPLLATTGEHVTLFSITPPTGTGSAPLNHRILFSTTTMPSGTASVEIPLARTALVFRKSTTDNYVLYEYESSKPWKNLTTADTVRVSDKVPVRALAQEITGNRIIYGNYINKNTPPKYLNYEVKVSEKEAISSSPILNVDRLQYPTQTLKQNRSYQVGFVLADKYGRQSNVITRDPKAVENELWKNDTVFAEYTNSENILSGTTDPIEWPGNSLKLLLNEAIPPKTPTSRANYPGLWSETNPLGWYSYKIVIKQQDQEYYNVYLPGALSGQILWESAGTGSEPTYVNTSRVSNISLYGDNINKIPRELKEVGPSDKNYGSIVDLWPRLIPNNDWSGSNWLVQANKQMTRKAKKVGVISMKNFRDLGVWATTKGNFTPDGASAPFYPYGGGKFIDPLFNADEDPIVASISVNNQIGLDKADQEHSIPEFSTALTVFETTPTYSNLPLYYESSTSGLISDLNAEVGVGGVGVATQTSPINWHFTEAMGPGEYITGEFELLDRFLTPITSSSTAVISFTVTNGLQVDVSSDFTLEPTQLLPYPKWRIKTNIDFPYHGLGGPDVQYDFTMNVVANNHNSTISWSGTMGNEPPCLWNWPLSSVIPIPALLDWNLPMIATAPTGQVGDFFEGITYNYSPYGGNVFPGGVVLRGTIGPFAPDSTINCSTTYPPLSSFPTVPYGAGWVSDEPAYFTNGCFSQPGDFPGASFPSTVGGAGSVTAVCTDAWFTEGCPLVNEIYANTQYDITDFAQGQVTATRTQIATNATPIDFNGSPFYPTTVGQETFNTYLEWNRWRRADGTFKKGKYDIYFKLKDEGGMLSNDEYVIQLYVYDNACVDFSQGMANPRCIC